MWVRQFWNGDNSGDTLDTPINQYLDNNLSVEIVNIKFAVYADLYSQKPPTKVGV